MMHSDIAVDWLTDWAIHWQLHIAISKCSAFLFPIHNKKLLRYNGLILKRR